ncbi:hypothetical protein MHI48_08000 [Paenibacillus sp. FSL H7-0942]|uniref:hypothetical protein n=1 Tax=Paenibacillus TaxID=44249 RepID=UPI00096E0A02|nr:hypothetical protein [Paenibacillus amylolyticus]OMF10112.1 hypothetical protein BK129_04615 [Paenibacillus amylolyticus]
MNENELQNVNINESFSKELINTSLDLTIDYSEVALDALLSDNITSEIPIVKTIVSLGKLGSSTKQLHFTKKVLCFLREFHSRNLTDNFCEFKNKLKTDDKFKYKVTEQIILIIDRLRTEKRSVLFAKLFIGHIQEKYDWETFCYFSECLDSMQPIDIDVLRYLFDKESDEIENIDVVLFDKYMLFASVERLKSFGFVGFEGMTWIDSKRKAFISSLGIVLYNAIAI